MMNSQRVNDAQAFSLVELLVVVVVLSILTAVTSGLLKNGWRALDDSMIRSQLQIEANLIAERLTADSLGADRAQLSDDRRELTLFESGGGLRARYEILSNAGAEATLGVIYPDFDEARILSGHVRLDDSIFELDGRYLRLNLVLARNTFNREVSLVSSVEALLRN